MGRGRWGRLRRYGEQDRRIWEEEEKEEELPSLVAAIHEGEIITSLTVIKLVCGWDINEQTSFRINKGNMKLV